MKSQSLSRSDAALVPFTDTSKLERIHSGARHRLYRGVTDAGPVVVKIAAAKVPAAAAVASMRHEYELLRELDLPGIVKVVGLANSNEGLALVMSDGGSRNLAEQIRLGPLSVGEFLDVATQLAETVARLHNARIVHRDINPSNVIWDVKGRHATLGDFGIATTLSTLTIDNVSLNEIEGTLAYVSPEQTGRIGRSMDSRTDLYSLGASFYEMLAGAPPFSARDPIELVHAHIARHPRPLHETRPEVPLPVSRIVSKLLAKEPEQRYQTAEALSSDLRETRRQWAHSGSVVPFPLAYHDVPRELNIPDKLYGRGAQLQTLSEAFARACQGGRELVLITGTPGIGKSALVSHLGGPISQHRGYYVAGKFDQLQRSVPFSGVTQAFRALVRQLLTEPEAVLAGWRERIDAAVAPNGQLLVDLVPDLERILGRQPAVPDVGPVESRNRFHWVISRFIQVFAQREHPLTLFLDDLQWVDMASLQLFEQVLADTACHHLLLIGAYRDSEIGSAHPLTLALAAWRAAGGAVHEIHLGPIGRDDVAQLAADAFNVDVATTTPLADLILHKTAGNPFFVRRLLQVIHSEGFISYVPQSHSWQWDLGQIERAPVADNVLALMVQAIERLPTQTRELLEAGACIGHRFELGTLAEVSGLSRPTTTDRLWPALESGMLLPVGNAYKAPRLAGPFEDSLDALPRVVQFAHDRIQQAAYSLLTEERRRTLHLDIGRRLLSSAGDAQIDERLFDIVDQFDLGESLVADPAEHLRLVELNMAAGRKARASAAHQAAFEYFSVARRHLSDKCWDEPSDVTFALHRELAECAYLTGQHAIAEELIETGLEHAPSKLAKADLYSLRVLAATVAGDWLRALRWGRDGLAVFGLEWPLQGLAEVNEAEARAVMTNLGHRRIEELVGEREVTDEETRACMRLISILGPPAYFSGADVLTYLVTRAANLSLLHGPSAYSAYAYVFYGGIHNERTGEYDVGYAFGNLALALARRFGNRAEECRTLEVFGLVVHPWKASLRNSLPLLREGFRAGIESGELAYAAFNLNSVLINGLPAGLPLADILADAQVAIDFATQHQNRASVEIAVPFQQVARVLMDAAPAPGGVGDHAFDEALYLEEAKENLTALGHYWVGKLQAAFLLRDFETARRASQKSEKLILSGTLGMVTTARHVFYTALTLAAEYPTAPNTEAATSLTKIRALHRKLVVWAEHCPDNFAHQAALVGAEIARLASTPADAMTLYRAAIDLAARNLFIQDEALAHEIRARFFLGEQEREFAAVHFQAAWERYQRWGAVGKTRVLEREYPEYFAADPQGPGRSMSIDALALIKASQAISAETVPERVFERILHVVTEVAGAQAGALVLCEADALTVRARIATAADLSISLDAAPLEQCADIPSAIVRYVIRVKEPLVLFDAMATGDFSTDAVVRHRELRSVLCVPLTSQGRVIGLIYLENGAMAGAFADELVETVQVLASQAVISLENAHLHQASRQEIEQRRQAEQALSEADRRKDEFLAMLAHELRNPLAPISTASEILARMLHGDARALSSVNMIKRQTTQLTRIVDDLLDVSRVTQGRVQLIRQTIDLQSVIAPAIETVEPLLHAKQHHLSVTAPSEPLFVDGDFVRLVQCVGNILTNAAKYTAAGGKISVQVRALEASAIIEITDNGVGITPQLLPRVFDLFVQGERTLDRAQGGLGVGLSVVKRMVQLHGGEVFARSAGDGRGSTFEIRLTRIEAPQASLPNVAKTDGTHRRVLVVDDNEDAANAIVTLLNQAGHETEAAYSGKKALQRLESFEPDIVLLDLGLPEMDGYEVARRIRAITPRREIRVVALSGYGQADDRLRTKAAGFDDHLVKPVETAVLERTILGAEANDRSAK